MQLEIYVYAGWLNDAPVGTVYATQSNGKEIVSFEYTDDWLREHSDIFLDPDLISFFGRQYAPNSKLIFGLYVLFFSEIYSIRKVRKTSLTARR